MKESDIDRAITYFDNMTTNQRDEVISTITAALLSEELGTNTWTNFMRVQINKTTGYVRNLYKVLAMFTDNNIEDFMVAYLDRPFDFKKRPICKELEKLVVPTKQQELN